MSDVLKIEERTVQPRGVVIIVTIQRPEALNALNEKVIEGLEKFTFGLEGREGIAGLILTGVGEKSFVAGADISELTKLDVDSAKRFAGRGQSLMRKFASFPFPVLAAVNGFALGGGCELALACDFIYASTNAKFGLPECSLGVIPGFGGTVRLHRRIGMARALEWTFSGEMITADEGFRMGLVNKVFPQAELMPACLNYFNTTATRAPLALGFIKRSIYQGSELVGSAADQLEAQLFANCFATSDQKEGTKAFLEKRKPEFKGH